MTGPFTFSLTDAQGVEHAYSVMPHNADAGFALSAQLVELGIEPIAAGIGQALAAAGPDGIRGLLDADASGLLASVDIGALGKRLGPLVAALPKLRPELFRAVTRDGAALSSPVHFNAAYQRNYAELYLAIWKIVEGNGFLPLPGTSPGAA